MNYYRGIDNELHPIGDRYDADWLDASIAGSVPPSGQWHEPTSSEQALADIACFGNFNENGGQDGMNECDLPMVD
jgi:hypothetical protein